MGIAWGVPSRTATVVGHWKMQIEIWLFEGVIGTSLELPMTPEGIPKKERIIFQPSIFRCYCWWFRNPKAPPGMYKTLWIMGWTTSLNWLAGFLNHQQYFSFQAEEFPFWVGKCLFEAFDPPFPARHFDESSPGWASVLRVFFWSAGRSVSRRPKWKLRLSRFGILKTQKTDHTLP